MTSQRHFKHAPAKRAASKVLWKLAASLPPDQGGGSRAKRQAGYLALCCGHDDDAADKHKCARASTDIRPSKFSNHHFVFVCYVTYIVIL